MLYTLPGIPSIYYGSEFGIEGKKGRGAGADDPLRPEMVYEDWTAAMEENAYNKFIAALGNMRQQVKALSYGDYKEQNLTTRQYTFSRSYEGSTVVVMVNNDDNACTMHGGAPDGTYTGVLSGKKITVCGGGFSTEIAGNSGEIWVPDVVEGKIETVDVTPVAEPVVENVEPVTEKVLDLNKPYEEMSIEELQACILAKMAKNGPVTAEMKRTVDINVHHGSLMNWVRSFNN